ncbi:transmembrane protein 18 [Tanacetum coccineum]
MASLIINDGAVAGVYLAERLNAVLSDNWKSFAGQKYLDHHGVFLSVLWSGPLLVFSTIILVNTLFSLCQLIVIWKRAELKHCARLSNDNKTVKELCTGPNSRSSKGVYALNSMRFARNEPQDLMQTRVVNHERMITTKL